MLCFNNLRVVALKEVFEQPKKCSCYNFVLTVYTLSLYICIQGIPEILDSLLHANNTVGWQQLRDVRKKILKNI